ncbi:hypothetical protein BDW71DRAFT_204774 [Aspergillus fruticulosus]
MGPQDMGGHMHTTHLPPAPGYGGLGVASDPGCPSAFPEYQGTLMASGHDKDSLTASTTGTFTS